MVPMFWKHISIFILFFSLIPFRVYAEKKVELCFWQFLVPERRMRAILDEFEKKYPHIKVKMQQLNWRDGLDKITTSIAAGITSDVCELGSTWTPQFAESGALLDISEYMQERKDEFLPILLSCVEWNNQYYGVPWVAGTRVLFYNKELFRQAGLDPEKPPKNWEELYKYVLELANRFPDLYPFAIPVGENYTPWQTFLPFFWSAGGELFDNSLNKAEPEKDVFVDCLRFYQKLSHHSLLARQAQIDRSFASGKVGMMISGGWNLSLIPRLNPRLRFGMALVPGEKKQVSFAGGEVLAIFKQTKYPEEAKLLVHYLTSEEVQNQIARSGTSFVPSLKNSLEKEAYLSSPQRKIFIEQLKYAQTLPPHPKWSQIQEELSWVIEDSLFNKTAPTDSFSYLTERLNKILSIYSKSRKKSTTQLPNSIVVLSIAGILALIVLINVCYRIKTRGIKTKNQRVLVLYLFLLPWLAIFLLFYLFPFVYSLILSFTDYSPLRGYSGFCGFNNYIEVLKDPEFQKALLHTFYFALGTCPVSILLALGCAVVIYKKIPMVRFIQASLFAPITISVIVAASMFSYFYSSEGFFNSMLDFLHLPRPFPDNWLMNPKMALISVMIMHVWLSFGFYMVIFTAGLYSIPRELLEASYIDGAQTWHRFRYIVLPQLKPFIILVIVLNTIKAFQVFPEVFAMTQGGPHGATLTLVYYLYKTGFHQFEMGKASAVGYILLVIIGFFLILEVTFLTRGKSNER
ncbi:MAG: extracellular solute-binding protein [Candidatus Auribacter fodinae]|uniref:Extracellular solute-binding protein n=1 Tax=Candidatus Auribacter fodinae TaxID=2093366 RepID=A0A3A4R8S3_9BACT|nr:MAG: extracellular solute-binding protein [Candidatus Auribacter fodinae]